MRRRILLPLVLSLAVSLLMAGTASAAPNGSSEAAETTTASSPQAVEAIQAVGCTGAPYPGEVCLQIRGSGLRVDWTKVILRNVYSTCNYRAAVRFTRPNGVVTSFTSGTHAGCSYGGGYITFYNSAGTYPHGTRVCGYWYDSTASPRGGRPCLYIYR